MFSFRTMRLALCITSCAVVVPLADTSAQEDGPTGAVCWIYRDIPSQGQSSAEPQLEQSPSELVYQPHFVYPATRTDDVVINDKLNLADLEDRGTGTVCEFGFRLPAGTFAGVKWIPRGTDPGTREGMDIHRELRATRATPVFLTFRARTAEDARVKVGFRLGATSGRIRDSLRFPEIAKPSPTRLTHQWKTISIPLKNKDLSSVICALEVLVKAEENPGVEVVYVYVDDVRFEVRRPE